MTMINKMKSQIRPSVMRSFRTWFGISLAFALFAFLFAACDAGLGESVDTMAPTVSITSPNSSAVMKGAFKISGSCVDDKAVGYVAVSITDTTTGKRVMGVNVPAFGVSWSLEVNKPVDGVYPLKDGIYSASAICFDLAGRQSGTASRVFEVDNTAPVFCLARPNSISIGDPAAYGRDVVVRGEIADDHAIKQMEIRVFKYQNNEATEITSSLNKTVFTGFETAGGTEIPIAKYFTDDSIPAADSDEYPLYLNYKAMYMDLGASVGDTVKLYVFPYLTDVAGNTSDKCYIQSSLKQLVSKACNVETTCDSLQTAQFKKILNGSYSLNELDTGTVKEILGGSYDQSQAGTDYAYYAHLAKEDPAPAENKNALAISINANNSPMYEFGGYSVDRESAKTAAGVNFAEVSSGGTMSVKVSAGLDGNEIIVNTIRVYLFACNNKLKPDAGIDLDELLKDPLKYASRADYYSDASDSSGKKVNVVDGNDVELHTLDPSVKTSNSTYKVTLPKGLPAGAYYLLLASGEDVALNGLRSDATHAFVVATTGDAPKIEFADQAYLNARLLNTDGGYSVRINITDKTDDPDKGPGKGTLKSNGWVSVHSVLYAGHAKTLNDIDESWKPMSGEGWTTDETTTFEGDQIKNRTNGSGEIVDGEFYIDFPVNRYDIKNKAKADNYTLLLEVTAKNISAITSDASKQIVWADNKAPELAVTAPTRTGSDTIPINILKCDQGIDSAGKYELSGTWKDLGGSGTDRIWWSNADSPATPTVTWNTPTDFTVNIDTTTANAWHQIAGASRGESENKWDQAVLFGDSWGNNLSFVAVDQAGNLTSVKTVKNVNFDFTRPAINAPAPNKYYKDASGVSLEFTITDDYKITAGKIIDSEGNKVDSVVVTAKKDGATVASGTNGYTCTIAQSKKDDGQGGLVDDPKSVTVKIVVKPDATNGVASVDGKWDFSVNATDVYDRRALPADDRYAESRAETKSFGFTIDTAAPTSVGGITIGESGTVDDWHKSKYLSISGKFAEMTSGLDKVYYKVNGGTELSETIGGKTGVQIPFSFSPAGFNEGSNTIEIKAEDLAGNKSGSAQYTIKIDTSAPLVSTSHYIFTNAATVDAVTQVDNLDELGGTILINGGYNIVVYGTFTENISGMKDMKFVLPAVTEEGKPKVISSGWKPFVYYYPASGKAVDGTVYCEKDSGVYVVKTVAAGDDVTGLYVKVDNGFIALIDKSKVPDGVLDINVNAFDNAGNKTDERKFGISKDTTPPKISIGSPKENATLNGDVTFRGAVEDASLKSVKAYWSYDSTATIDESGATPRDHEIAGLSGTYSWSVTQPVTKVVGGLVKCADGITDFDETAHSKIYLKIKADDKAGNQSVKVFAFNVDPNTDRPEIDLVDYIDSLKVAPKAQTSDPDHYWFVTKADDKTIKGSVSDDDGLSGLKLYYYDKYEDPAASGSAGSIIWTEIALTNGSFALTLPDTAKDGPHEIMFKIDDAKGTSFITKAPAATTAVGGKDFYLSPKVKLNKKELESDGSLYTNLYLTIDSDVPTYTEFKYATKNTDGTYSAETTNLGKVGGKKKFIRISFDAEDANGVSKVEFVLNGGAAGTVTTTKQGDKYKCEIKDIDVSKNALPTGDYSAKVTIIGNADDKIEVPLTISVDNTAPKVYNFAPKTDAAKPSSGDIVVRGEIDNADTLSYAMTYGTTTTAPTSYADITFANQKWSVTFDNQVDPNHDKTIEEYVKAWNKPEACSEGTLKPVGDDGTDNIANYKFDAIVPIKIWVKAEDDVGNESVTEHVFKFDPQGGRPELNFNYPESNAVKDGGNNITIRGDATDDQGVKAVFLQIISTTHRDDIYTGSSWGSATYDSAKDDVTAFNLTKDDLNYLKAAGYKVIRMKAYPAAQTEWSGSGEPSEYGILTTLKSIWSQKINEKDEFSPVKGSSVTSNPLYIKALAFDGQKLSVPKYRRFVIDNDKPTISKIFLRRYSGSAKIASREYSNGVYLKGDGSDWKLGFTLEDNQGLANYRIGISATSADEAKDNAEAASKTTISGGPKTFATSVSLGSTKKFIHIKFEDTTGYENEYAFAINYDSVNPVVNNPTFVNNSTEKKIYNDNGKYSVGARVVDDDSRFDKLVVYYMRDDKTVFDPMFPKAKPDAGTYKHSYSVGSGSGAVYEDGLYWFKQTVTRDASNLSVLTLSADPNEHIHKGRLVKIGGMVYTIKNVDGKNIVLDGNVEADWTEAKFNYGIVIDNTTMESASGAETSAGPYGYKYPKNITSDDGDGMVEYAQDVGDFMLEAELNSKNIPDGPINVYYVAYDRAGNCSALGSVTGATVSNNAPRLANVTVASDFNFDSVYNAGDYVKNADGESRAYYETSKAYEDADTAVTLGGASDPWIAAKGTVKVSPEVLGGNGSLTWAWTYPKGGVQTAGVGGTLSTDTPTEESEYDDRKRDVNAIMLPEATLGTADADCGDYNITISDQTDGVAQKATIKLYLQNDVNDGKKPIAKTKRFFWKTLTNNSVYGSSSAKTVADLQGHIDLEKAAETADGDASETTNTQPKVSGKIVLKGTAYDNTAIKTLTVTVPGFNEASALSVSATRTFGSSGAWTGADQGSIDSDGYHFVVDTAGERFNNAGHYVSWTLELDTQKHGGGNAPAANNVKFALSVNDKKGNASVESAGKVKVYANKKQAEAGKYYADKRFAEKDTSSSFARADYSADEFSDAPASIANAVTEYELSPVSSAYTMDIVPYITRVETSLSGVNATNGVTDRSSLGAYPVYIYKNSTATPTILSTTSGDVNASETVKIYGFNLKGSVYNKGASANYASYKTDSATGKNWVEIDSKNLVSGDFALSVNGVDTINNSNNDNARGSYANKPSLDGGEYDVYKNYYNRQPNNANNNNLTDNIAFDVWQLNNMAAAPMSETADDPQMKILPVNTDTKNKNNAGRIGFAFSDGSSAFAMPNTDHSWTYWAYDYDRVRYAGLNYDPQGYAWAAATGQDTFGSGGDPFFMETTRNRETGGHRVQGVTSDSKWKLERISIYETNEGDYSRIMQDRIQSPAFANTTNGVYLAYYYVGLNNAEIRFRAGTSASANAGNAFDMFQNDGTLGVTGNNGNAKYTTANVQLLAGGTGAAAKNAAPYVSLAAVDGLDHIDEDVVVIVWYDGSKMIYGYLKDPLEKDGQDKIKIRGNTTAAGWTFIDNIFPAGVGEYCKIATDQLGGVHIAAYDTNNADVYYAYMPKYNATAKTGKVDSYDATGFYLTLDAALEPDSAHSGAGVLPAPQIGFYSTVGNRPKYARWNTGKEGSIAAATDLNGTDKNDSFTGRWEVVNVPTISSSVRKNDPTNGVKQNINVGVWKLNTGNMSNSTTGESVCVGSATGGTSGTSANNYGDVYGNGTANAVLSYTYGNGTAAFIETAQRAGDYKK